MSIPRPIRTSPAKLEQLQNENIRYTIYHDSGWVSKARINEKLVFYTDEGSITMTIVHIKRFDSIEDCFKEISFSQVYPNVFTESQAIRIFRKQISDAGKIIVFELKRSADQVDAKKLISIQTK